MRCFRSVLFACAIFWCATTASAGVLNGFAGALLSGRTDFQGFSDYPLNTPGKETGLAGYIEWAVFSPDTFPTGAGQFSGYTPTTGQFVYTYQAFETGGAPLSSLSVTLQTIANNIGSFSGLGVTGQLPSASYFFPSSANPTSANWDFSPTVSVGSSTSGLAFSSPFGPQMLEGSTIDDGSVAAVVPLPSPAPEPGMVIFWSFGIVFTVVRTLRRRPYGCDQPLAR